MGFARKVAQFFAAIGAFFGFFTNAVFFLVVAYMMWAVIYDLGNPTISIENVELPRSISENRYSERSAARMLEDEIRQTWKDAYNIQSDFAGVFAVPSAQSSYATTSSSDPANIRIAKDSQVEGRLKIEIPNDLEPEFDIIMPFANVTTRQLTQVVRSMLRIPADRVSISLYEDSACSTKFRYEVEHLDKTGLKNNTNCASVSPESADEKPSWIYAVNDDIFAALHPAVLAGQRLRIGCKDTTSSNQKCRNKFATVLLREWQVGSRRDHWFHELVAGAVDLDDKRFESALERLERARSLLRGECGFVQGIVGAAACKNKQLIPEILAVWKAYQGFYLLSLNKFADAEGAFSRSDELHRLVPFVQLGWGLSILGQNKARESVPKFESAYRNCGKAAQDFTCPIKLIGAMSATFWGVGLSITGQHVAAMEKFELSHRIEDSALNHLLWGSALRNYASSTEEAEARNRLEEAAIQFKAATNLDSESFAAWFWWGVTLTDLAEIKKGCAAIDDFREANRKFAEAEKRLPKIPGGSLYLSWGFSLLRLGQMELAPACGSQDKASSQFRLSQEKLKKAIQMFSMVNDKAGEGVSELLLGISIYSEKGDVGGVHCAHFKRAIDLLSSAGKSPPVEQYRRLTENVSSKLGCAGTTKSVTNASDIKLPAMGLIEIVRQQPAFEFYWGG